MVPNIDKQGFSSCIIYHFIPDFEPLFHFVAKGAVINSTREGAGRESADLKKIFITLHQFAVWFNGPTKNSILVS